MLNFGFGVPFPYKLIILGSTHVRVTKKFEEEDIIFEQNIFKL